MDREAESQCNHELRTERVGGRATACTLPLSHHASEKITKTKSQGLRLEEAKKINKVSAAPIAAAAPTRSSHPHAPAVCLLALHSPH